MNLNLPAILAQTALLLLLATAEASASSISSLLRSLKAMDK